MISSLLKELWNGIKKRGENIGLVFIIMGVLTLFLLFGLVLKGLKTETGLLGAALGLISVGLGFTAIGMSVKLDISVARIPTLIVGDILTLYGHIPVKETPSELSREAAQKRLDQDTKEVEQTRSKEAAQKRLDQDTKKVGYVRGEIYQLEDGSWGIHWGGEYPL